MPLFYKLTGLTKAAFITHSRNGEWKEQVLLGASFFVVDSLGGEYVVFISFCKLL